MNRKYTEAELKAILAKAVQEEGAESQDGSDGLSLAEIKEIGAEVGIGAGSLERAARSMDPIRGRRQAALAGGLIEVAIERTADGDIESVPTGKILSVIRARMGTPGDLTQLKGLLEWRSSGELGHHVITLSSKDGVTTIDGMVDLRQAAILTHLPASFLGLIAAVVGFMIAANQGNEIGMLFSVGLLPAVMLATRTLYSRLWKSESRKLERVAEELAELIRSSDETALTQPKPRLVDLDERDQSAIQGESREVEDPRE